MSDCAKTVIFLFQSTYFESGVWGTCRLLFCPVSPSRGQVRSKELFSGGKQNLKIFTLRHVLAGCGPYRQMMHVRAKIAIDFKFDVKLRVTSEITCILTSLIERFLFGQHYQRRPRPARRWIILLLKSLLNYRFHVYPAGLSPPLPSLPLICILLSVLLLWLAFTLVSVLLAVIMMCHEIMI